MIMNANKYLPEGSLIGTQENNEYISSLAGLERAAAQGVILEAPAILCDGMLDLTVDLGAIRGIIRKNEVAYVPADEQIKDIAVISRVGKPVCFKVVNITYDSKGRPVAYLSRRAAQIECINNFHSTLINGDVIPAKVTHLEHFGAFVDIGCGIVSLLSIDCISVSRISHPADRFYVGMQIKVIVKSIESDSGRIFVTHKELLGTWEENVRDFKCGQTVMGVVRSIEQYGVFVELAPNLAGLAEFREDVSVGQSVAVYIKNIIPERMKIKLIIIDICRSEVGKKGIHYFIGEECEHIGRWKYSPESTPKLIESVF